MPRKSRQRLLLFNRKQYQPLLPQQRQLRYLHRRQPYRPPQLYRRNLSRAYGIAKGNAALAGTAFHGIIAEPIPKRIPQSLVKFPQRKGTLIFQELLKLLGGNPGVLGSPLRIGHLMPQILPGHRLWCYATNKAERVLTVERFEVMHSTATKEAWLNIYLSKGDFERLAIKETTILSQADMEDFEISASGFMDFVCLQQRRPDSYTSDPAEALSQVIKKQETKSGTCPSLGASKNYRWHDKN